SKLFSVCNLCVLCVSVVTYLTTETQRLHRDFNTAQLRFLSRAKARRDRGRFWPSRPLRCQRRARVQCAPDSSSTRCSKAYRTSWQQLTAACYLLQAIHEVANPVLWVRGANLRCELIAQAAHDWQGSSSPCLPRLFLYFLELVHTQIQEDLRNGTARLFEKSLTIASDQVLTMFALVPAPKVTS